jgi:hypothetical protein
MHICRSGLDAQALSIKLRPVSGIGGNIGRSRLSYLWEFAASYGEKQRPLGVSSSHSFNAPCGRCLIFPALDAGRKLGSDKL